MYHIDVYMPQQAYEYMSNRIVMPTYSMHAVDKTTKSKYGNFTLPRIIDLSNWQLIEAEIIDSKLHKILIRKNIDEYRSLCLVLLTQRYFVKTAWINLISDNHSSLERSHYERN